MDSVPGISTRMVLTKAWPIVESDQSWSRTLDKTAFGLSGAATSHWLLLQVLSTADAAAAAAYLLAVIV
jgi:hypothetical protein